MLDNVAFVLSIVSLVIALAGTLRIFASERSERELPKEHPPIPQYRGLRRVPDPPRGAKPAPPPPPPRVVPLTCRHCGRDL